MFRTIGHTFELMRMSWRVLMQDRELVLFPVMSGAVLLVAMAVFYGVAVALGTIDRFAAAEAGAQASPTAVDWVFGGVVFFTTYFVSIFFNSALVAAALERLRGGNPSVVSGLRHATARLPAIFGWALIAATVGLILSILRDRMDNVIGRIALLFVGGAWAVMTFFVVPVLVAENLGPVEAIKRSGSLLRQTWGRQIAASFGFGLVYIVGGIAAFAVAAGLFFVHPILGVVGGALAFTLLLGIVAAMEGIFKAALYEFANGETPLGFDRATLSSAYRAL